MSIYKVKFRCTNCKYLWVEDAPLDTMDTACPECKCDKFTCSIYNDSIANIDDEMGEEN